jgi:cyclic-di-GMP-binding protein
MSIQPLWSGAQIPASLLFSGSEDCARWIESLPITNIQHAHKLLSEQTKALGAASIAAIERLKILEVLKPSVKFVQAEMAKRYLAKSLPLDAADADAWNSVIALWGETGNNYQRCLDAYREGDLPIAPFAALITLRRLRCINHALFAHYHVYREPSAAMWKDYHILFAFAEDHGISRIRVQDMFAKQEADSSCAEAYVHGLLGNLANPYSLSVRQMDFVQRWLDKWTALVGLSAQPLPPGQIPPLAVDFNSDSAATFPDRLVPGPAIRYLDLEQLSKTLRNTINLLKQGNTPAQLGLGDDARQPGCENLIMLLYVQWCRAGMLRSEERNPADDPATVCFGMEDAHKLVSSTVPREVSSTFSSRDKWEQDNLGYSLGRSQTILQSAMYRSEKWQILNQSSSGFMCMLRDPDGTMRLSHNQLLAVQRASDTTHRLGMVQWLRVGESKEFQCGVRMFPGVPQAVKVRPSNFSLSGRQNFEQALMLPEIAVPSTPATIVLPAGWFQPGRMIEFNDGQKKAKLLNLLERGSDFDRGTFVYA